MGLHSQKVECGAGPHTDRTVRGGDDIRVIGIRYLTRQIFSSILDHVCDKEDWKLFLSARGTLEIFICKRGKFKMCIHVFFDIRKT